jgi:hypothetical protein
MLKRVIFIMCLFVVSASNAQSQNFRKAFEMGFMGGGSYYIGDINPNKHFIYSKPAFGVIARYNLSKRHSFRATASYGSVVGQDAKSKDSYQLNRNLSFSSTILELAVGFEIDLLKYRISDTKYPVSPYFFYEIAYFRMNPVVKGDNDEKIVLQEIGTEGQGTVLSSKNPYTLNQISIPLGIGVKFTVKKRLAISLEYGIRKTFTDYLDDVSGQYVNPVELGHLKGPLAAQLADPSLNGASYQYNGLNRGNSNNKDWYAMYGVMITFQPWKPTNCPFQPRKNIRKR